MSLVLVDSYLDASGKSSNVNEKIITVNGCLSTGPKWADFDLEWQSALQDLGFKPERKFGRYVFHTADFHSGHCKLSPSGLLKADRQRIYRELLPIVRKHSLYLVGFAVTLKDYERFGCDYPIITKYSFGKPGTFVSILCAGKLMEWAGQHGYSKSISMMFDQGDEFWGEMSHGFQAFVKNPINEHLHIGSLMSGDKAEFSPLQAADIVAWECRQHFGRLANVKMPIAGIRIRPELEMLRRPHSLFTLYEYDDLKRRVSELFPDAPNIEAVERGIKRIADQRDTKLLRKREKRNERKKNRRDYE